MEPEVPDVLLLTPEVVEDDQALGELVDNVIRLDPLARRRAAEINEHFEWLRSGLDADTWRLVLEIDARVTERWSELAVVLVRYGWQQGRRHPMLKEEDSP